MRAFLVAVTVLLSSPAQAKPSTEEQAWLGDLTARVVEDLAAGRPLVAQVHVPLCDNTIIACGNAKLGNGDNPETNLYWATTPGFGKWFARKDGGWKRVLKQTEADSGDKDLLAVHVYRKTVSASAAWKKQGAPAKFEIDIVVYGWRGTAIDRALDAYALDSAGSGTRTLTLADGTTLAAGGAAQLVAWVGHNRLMDLDAYTWPAPAAKPMGTIAIACHTASYMEAEVSAPTRVPLLMTRDFLFANAAPLEATVLAFAGGESYAKLRSAAAAAYAKVQKKEVRKVAGAFTNPSDRRWRGAPSP
jgi:hypothetical protein